MSLKASRTAAWVTTCRALAGVLPPGDPICDDPLAYRLASGLPAMVAPLLRARPRLTWAVVRRIGPVALSIYWVQLRTRLLDEVLSAFASGGGDQVVLLGAGYDSRASRFRRRFPSLMFFEVDHPATQAAKRRRLRDVDVEEADTRYVDIDLEREPVDGLAARLAEVGMDRSRPTLTIWEGVTMYLTADAISRTVLAICDYSAPGSRIAFDYYRKQSLGQRSLPERILAALAIERDEPFRFGWDPTTLPGWLAERGFDLEVDHTEETVASRFLAHDHQRLFLSLRGAWHFHIAEAIRLPTGFCETMIRRERLKTVSRVIGG